MPLQEPSSHHPLLLEILAKELDVAAEDIVDFDLSLCDTQAGVIGGRIPGCSTRFLNIPFYGILARLLLHKETRL